MLEKRVSLKDAMRITGKPKVYCRQAMSGQLVDKSKIEEFLSSLKTYFD
jgi:hypothetical protein